MLVPEYPGKEPKRKENEEHYTQQLLKATRDGEKVNAATLKLFIDIVSLIRKVLEVIIDVLLLNRTSRLEIGYLMMMLPFDF